MNNDAAGGTSDPCLLSSSFSAGWRTSSAPVTLTLTPVGTAAASMTKNVPAGQPAATYGGNATAADANHSAMGTASITVTAPLPPPTPTVTVSVTPTSLRVRDTVTIQATVTNASGLVPVTFTLSRPNGP